MRPLSVWLILSTSFSIFSKCFLKSVAIQLRDQLKIMPVFCTCTDNTDMGCQHHTPWIWHVAPNERYRQLMHTVAHKLNALRMGEKYCFHIQIN